MELVSKKFLMILCGLCLTAAVAEGYLLYRDQTSQARYHSFDDPLTRPFAFAQRHSSPWDMVPRGFFPKDFMKDWNNDSFFGNKFQNGNLFEESFTMSGPKRDDKGDKVNLTFDIQGHEKGNFDVKVSNQEITVTGKDDQSSAQVTAEPKTKNGFWFWKSDKSNIDKAPEVRTKNESHWSMTQSYPLPDDVDPKNYTVERSDDKLTVVFKKLNIANSNSKSETENL